MRSEDAAELQAKVRTLPLYSLQRLTNTAKAQEREEERKHREEIQRLRRAQEDHRLRDLDAERKRNWDAAEEKDMTYRRAAPARAARRREAELHKKRFEEKFNARTTLTPYAATESLSSDRSDSYMAELRERYPPVEDPVERSKHLHATLASIPRAGLVSAGVGLPSGHSGINDDPVLAKYNQDRFVSDVLSHHQDYQALLRQQQEAEQRQAAEREAEYQRKVVLLEHHWSQYKERVAQLMHLGPVISSHLAYLFGAAEQVNFEALYQAAHALINDVLNPANSIFEDMRKEIMLETMGAESLKETWPLNDIERTLIAVDDQTLSQLPDIVQHTLSCMLQGLQTARRFILEAKPFENPLVEQQPHAFEARPFPATFMDFAKKNSQQRQQPLPSSYGLPNQQPFQTYQGLSTQQALPPFQSQQAQQQPQPAAAPQGDNAGKNFSSFADLTKATKDANQHEASIFVPSKAPGSFGVSSGFSSAAAHQQTAFAASKAPGSFGVSSNTSSTAQTPQVGGLLAYINQIILDFQDNVNHLLREGKMSVTRRKDIEEVLKDVLAQSSKGMFGPNDAQLLKREVERLVKMIGSMKNAKEQKKQTTRDLQALAHNVLPIWA
jgi:hypothetical protein